MTLKYVTFVRKNNLPSVLDLIDRRRRLNSHYRDLTLDNTHHLALKPLHFLVYCQFYVNPKTSVFSFIPDFKAEVSFSPYLFSLFSKDFLFWTYNVCNAVTFVVLDICIFKFILIHFCQFFPPFLFLNISSMPGKIVREITKYFLSKLSVWCTMVASTGRYNLLQCFHTFC